ncbi:hypothetical protein CAOG_06971 [Capsaspora owczarzaki ATCC 30864]|uniref:Protein-lysine N-methyltransferase CAOG_006971 n=1 Tax=Capsaspora owczarzaki (strain ATCC 30864) TaxID=595528 RepID=A0A0D2VYB1_CAPO3|nr:hypothetical protein CAOG_06971 [Capsaspora owczarzaki ATCC 30864]KJE96692.1 hypothetical protein CAOG_006971 [Capsaspora owczarzaki ATCC 30864]|eukprot:XP_004343695.2 hypothetical protein CAOG_06971 [Capsaspora owczarzaki ATCC 30864]
MADDAAEIAPEPSKLGTREYWDQVYEREVGNFDERGDVGEVWFGMDAVESVVDWIQDDARLPKHLSVVDIGCGNGVSLVELARVGFKSLLGIDYSEPAIELARKVAAADELDIDYQVFDFINDDVSALQNDKNRFPFDLCIDKGTYDAISLAQNSASARAAYVRQVHALCSQAVKPRPPSDDDDENADEEEEDDDDDRRRKLSPRTTGLFIITSCNWTNDELKAAFASHFTTYAVIKYRVFEFGGKKGSSISTVIFAPKPPSEL